MGFKNIFKKTIHLEENKEANLEAVELWEVRWYRRYGEWKGDTEPVVEVFTNQKDAEIFYNRLKDAKELLKYDENINLTMKKKS